MTATDFPLRATEATELDVLDVRTRAVLEHRRRTGTLHRRGWLVRRALATADVGGLLLAFAVAQWLFAEQGADDRIQMYVEALLFALTLPGWVVAAKLYRLYDRDEERTDHSTVDDLGGVFHMVTVGAWLLFAGSWATGWADPQLPKVVAFWALAVGLVTTGRAVARGLARREIAYLQNTIIVGAGDVGQLLARKLLKHPEYGLNLVGFVDAQPKGQAEDLAHLALLGTPDDLRRLIRLYDVERVIVAFSNDGHDETLELVRDVRDIGVQVDLVPRLFELLTPGVSLHTIEGLPLVGLAPPQLSRSSRFLKRAMDVVLTSLGLLLLAPLLAIVAIAVKLDSSGPVFFRQVRMGEGGRPFRILKFRTMVADAEARKDDVRHLNRWGAEGKMFKVENDPRITRVGILLRRTCLDELPQLLNVLRGEMSLVGPRPLIPEEARLVRSWGTKRIALKPGITGLWQVLGSSSIEFDEMVGLDYLYVTNWGIATDVRLLLRTLPVVLRGANERR